MRYIIPILWISLSWYSLAFAGDFFLTENNIWFDATDKSKVNAVIEIKNLSSHQVESILHSRLPDYLFSKVKIVTSRTSRFEIKVILDDMSHAELIKIKSTLPEIERMGGQSLSPEIPLALRIQDLKGHDDFLANISGLPLEAIKQIDTAVEKSKHNGKPILVRYFLDDRKKTDPEDYKHLIKFYGDSIITVIPANTFGKMPVYVPGESVVFHSRTFHGKTLLGQINPGLVNSNIVQAITANKYVESLFWEQYAPGALPETRLLAHLNLDFSNPQSVVDNLNQMYPTGWVMKGINESSSNFSIITDKTELVQEIKNYQNSDFEKFKQETYRKLAGFDEDNIYEALQEHANYFGWRASLYLKNPQNVIVQKKVAIDREFRVEAVGGRVLKGATIDRHNWWLEMKNLPFVVSPKELVERIEDYTQSVIDKLPPELKETNFAFDIALLKNGQFIVIESNAGSESGFLVNQDTSAEILNKLIEKYPELKKAGIVKARGLSQKDQMQYLKERFRKWNLNLNTHYPTYTFSETEVQTGLKSVQVHQRFLLDQPGMMCSQVLY